MRILQANMHRSRTADALLDQIAVEKAADAIVISEQYGRTSRSSWFEDETGTAAIWLPRNSKFLVIGSGSGPGFTYVRNNKFTLMSCYLTPSDSIREFEIKLNSIEDKIQEVGGHLIVSGDFNSRAAEWGMTSTNSRGRRVLDMAARLGLVVANRGTVSTFRRPGCNGTIPDITLISEGLLGNLQNWRVLEDFTGSDHQYIMYNIVVDNRRDQRPRHGGTRIWNVSGLDTGVLLGTIDENTSRIRLNVNDLSLVNATMECIREGCNASMPRLSTRAGKTSVYWWSDEIAELRRKCLRSRRIYTRAKRNSAALHEAEDFKNARKELKIAINRAKKDRWEELRNDLNKNPWGLGYRIVISKLGARTPLPELDSNVMTDIVNTLFPTHEQRTDDDEAHLDEHQTPLFTMEELRAAARGLKGKKAPGPDGVPNEVIKLIAMQRPQLLLDMYNVCLSRGVFPTRWKKQQLMLISKGKGDPSQASAYRPLCMLDSAGKLLERLLKPRLSAAVEAAGGLSERQHGFRVGRSTIGAINDVVARVKATQRGNHYSRKIVLLATLDIRNAFNSLRWADVLEALKTRFSVPGYLQRMLESYLSDRELIYHTSEGRRKKRITSGAAQGSILGPDLWNISYDDIFRIEMPDETHLIGYADDVAAVIVARNMEEVRRKLNQVMMRTQSWLEDRGLQLATEKTELILLTRQHIPLELDVRVCDTTLRTKKVVSYLGIRLDPRLTFWAQIHHAAIKASKVSGLLCKLMANVGGPTQSKRRLLMETVNSILLYGSETWASALKVESRRRVLSAVQRTAALRVASAYRTVSESAVLVISSMIPIDLQAYERKILWQARNANDDGVTAADVRSRTLQQWQQRWTSDSRGRWTAKILPDIPKWVGRKFGEVNYYLTQLLSGHGYFCKYLHRMGKMTEPGCIYGDSAVDSAEHTFFYCEKWSEERARLEATIGVCTVDNWCDTILRSENNWNIMARYIEHILRSKKGDLDERIRAES